MGPGFVPDTDQSEIALRLPSTPSCIFRPIVPKIVPFWNVWAVMSSYMTSSTGSAISEYIDYILVLRDAGRGTDSGLLTLAALEEGIL